MMANKDATGGFRLYVIGDIHGRADLLDKIVDEIRTDIEKHKSDNCFTITLGDYVDRGPDLRGVIDRLVRNPFPTRYIALTPSAPWTIDVPLRIFLANILRGHTSRLF